MAKKTSLEAELTAVMHEFVGRVLELVRNASFAEVAELSWGRPSRATTTRRSPAPPKSEATRAVAAQIAAADAKRKPRQTADKRAELATRVLAALQRAGSPMGVRALSSELAVAPDLLAQPLKELRAAGRVHKHGEKRATTYSAAER